MKYFISHLGLVDATQANMIATKQRFADSFGYTQKQHPLIPYS